jgi:hypothetical protein
MWCAQTKTIGQKAEKKTRSGSEVRGDGKRNLRGFADVVALTTGDAG